MYAYDYAGGDVGTVNNWTLTFLDLGGTPAPIQTAGLPSGSEFPVGTTTNTFEVTDASGNTSTCSFDVVVSDVEGPALTCPADIEVENDLFFETVRLRYHGILLCLHSRLSRPPRDRRLF